MTITEATETVDPDSNVFELFPETVDPDSTETPDPRILIGDCRARLAQLPDNSVSLIATDPPYGLSKEPDVEEVLRHWLNGDDYTHTGGGFMGKTWDSFVPGPAIWRECFRVLRPGGHLMAFGGTRTYDLMAIAIRLAGFEVRDSKHWFYGSGMPKSLDVSKAIDRAAGATRKVVGTKRTNVGIQGGNYSAGSRTGDVDITVPATEDARRWDGWGTALKPAHEPIIVARKPLDGTVASTVLTWGTGALNIDACRVGGRDGRWPMNVLLSHNHDCAPTTCTAGCPVAELDRQSGSMKVRTPTNAGASRYFPILDWDPLLDDIAPFLYVQKPNRAERDAGLDTPTEQQATQPKAGNGASGKPSSSSTGRDTRRKNHHPTVKPVSLMRWLIRLGCPPGGVVLDPFLGSGTTAVAAVMEGVAWIGCELTREYVPIIAARVAHAEKLAEEDHGEQLQLAFAS